MSGSRPTFAFWMSKRKATSSTPGTTQCCARISIKSPPAAPRFFKKYVWWIREPLDLPLMSRAARMLAGRHNFICFRAQDPSRPDESTIVVVEDAAIEEDGHLILFRITGSHFLWRMVRRIVGVLVKVGKGEITIDDFEQLLDGRSDPRLDVAAWTAPASGLFLAEADYQPDGLDTVQP